MKHYSLFLLVSMIWAGCAQQPEVSPIPQIEFVSWGQDQYSNLSNSVLLTISYIDGDGDIGQNEADVKNLFVTDTRNEVTYKFRVQQLKGERTGCAGIKGKLEILIPRPMILSGSTEEHFSYKVLMTDRAGNSSNELLTPEIELVR